MTFSSRSFDYSSDRLIPCVVLDGPPTEKTEGAIGVLCIHKESGNLYKCVAANYCDRVFTWKIVGDVSDDQIRQSVSDFLSQNPVTGGLSDTEKDLLLTLFKAMPYTRDVSATMKSLEAIWNSGSSGGDTSDIPDVTNYTVTYNLTSVTADNTPASVIEGGSLTVNLTPDTNAVMGEVTVTMGGVDVTADVYSNGKISISSVTGDVVITATATVASYTQVEYLETATKDAYIITNYTLKPTDLVECEWAGPPATQWTFPFSGCTNSGAMCKLRTRPDDTAGRTSYTRRGSGSITVFNDADPNFAAPYDNTTFLKFVESAPGTGAIYDTQGNVLCTLTDDSVEAFPDTGCVMGLFIAIVGGVKYGDAGATGMRIKYFKIKNAYGDAVLDLIPVLDENNVACMYDKVSGEYFYDVSGNNTFTAGGAV